VSQRRVNAHGLGVGFAVHEAREPVDPVATDAGASRGRLTVVVLVEQEADRKMGGMESQAEEVIVELLDPRLVSDGGIGEVAAPGPVGWIFPGRPVHVVKALGFQVPGLKVLIRERPRRRDATVVSDLPEVLRSESEQRGTVKLGVAADVVVLLG
jgi:hypothetical protein